jgi:hypothetical protein
MRIHVFSEPQSSCGFKFKEGFVALLNKSGTPVAATSGWECEGNLFVYRPAEDGSWAGSWEGPETFPVQEVLEAIQDWQDNQDLQKALSFAEGKKLHIAESDVVFTDVVPGEKRNNGGEYGFYTRYSPIPGYPGIYRVSTETTCDFDTCGTGYQGIRALTVREYRRLKKASDKVKEIKKQVDLYEEWNPICCQNGNPGIGWFSGDHPQCCGNCKGFIII